MAPPQNATLTLEAPADSLAEAPPPSRAHEPAWSTEGAIVRPAFGQSQLAIARSNAGLYPYTDKLPKAVYEHTLRELQVELIKLHGWIRHTGQRMIVLFEGRDAAGKGGAIKRFAEHLNPRQVRVVSLDKPTDAERGQWYFQRYINQLPHLGETVLFDRSWYNRAGVEHVMGFCTDEEYRAFFPQVNELERNLVVHSGYLVIKLWFDVSPMEQRRRIAERLSEPLKQWKLSPVDLKAIERWDDYTQAETSIFERTSTTWSPWTRIKSDCKRRARLQAMLCVLNAIDYDGKTPSLLAPDPLLVATV